MERAASYSDAAPDSIWTAGVFTEADPVFALRGAGAAPRAFRVPLTDRLSGDSPDVSAACPSMR